MPTPLEPIFMETNRYRSMSPGVRVAGALLAVLFSLLCLASVLSMFASASGELEPMLAKAKAPPASAVAGKTPTRPARG